MKQANKLFSKYFELLFWAAALILLAFSDPSEPGQYGLCPFKAIGFSWCPGCGLGHSISWLLQGNPINSWHAHWLGIPAFCVILYRIYSLLILRLSGNKAFSAG